MTKLEVSSVVDSILDAFRNGMDVFTRMRRRKLKRNGKPPRMKEEELRLHDSLSNRPKEIRAEYNSSVVKFGRQFEHGDDIAYSSLAHVLLVLNTGLINLINTALSPSSMDGSKSHHSLLLLSESAAAKTMQALSELHTRLSPGPQMCISPASEHNKQKSSKRNSDPTAKPRPAPSPLLARGAWVRSKSGSSVVSAVSAKSLAALFEEDTKPKSQTRCSKEKATESSIDLSVVPPKSSTTNHTCSCQNSPKANDTEWAVTTTQGAYSGSEERPPSMLLVPADYFDNQIALEASVIPPPRPPKIPLHTRPNPRPKIRPPSAATFLTASTRIGEIPEHKWGDRPLTEEEQIELPLPYVIPSPLEPPARRAKGLRFWKKVEKKLVAAD